MPIRVSHQRKGAAWDRVRESSKESSRFPSPESHPHRATSSPQPVLRVSWNVVDWPKERIPLMVCLQTHLSSHSTILMHPGCPYVLNRWFSQSQNPNSLLGHQLQEESPDGSPMNQNTHSLCVRVEPYGPEEIQQSQRLDQEVIFNLFIRNRITSDLKCPK